jgi:hypothetical protein
VTTLILLCRNGYSESRRSRRMVISFIATVVNYEYMFYWYLYQVCTGGKGVTITSVDLCRAMYASVRCSLQLTSHHWCRCCIVVARQAHCLLCRPAQ